MAKPSEATQKPHAPQQNAPQEQGGEDLLKLTGTPGVTFSCAVMDGNGQQRTVDGTVPQEIPLKEMGMFSSTYNSCQKMGAKGELVAQVVIDGKTEVTNKTSAQYGVVSADYPQ